MEDINSYIEEVVKLEKTMGRLPTKREWMKHYSHTEYKIKKKRISYLSILDGVKNKKTEDYDLDEWLELVETYQKLDKKTNPKSTYVKSGNPKSSEPMIVSFSADWHLGSRSCNYKQWKEDLKFILSLPPSVVRMFLVGDLIDNVYPGFKNAQVVFGFMSPEDQKKMLFAVLDKMKSYIDAACWGNHDVEWDEKRAGVSSVANMFGKQCHYFHGRGMIDFFVGSQKYKILMNHKLKGKSIQHSLGATIRGWNESHSDIVVCAHTHDPGYLYDYMGMNEDGSPKQRHLVQVGTYKTENDVYSDRNFKQGVSTLPSLVLYPNEYRAIHFPHLKDAVKWLKADGWGYLFNKKD